MDPQPNDQHARSGSARRRIPSATPTPVGSKRATPAEQPDVVVLGAGLAGLAAAATAGAAGARVLLIEARSAGGGRARSEVVAGFTVNHGAHALYAAGAGMRVLGRLGVDPRGRRPRLRRAGWWVDGRRVPAWHLDSGGGGRSIAAVARTLAAPGPGPGSGRSAASWLDERLPVRGRALAEAILRTATYAADLDAMDAHAALRQVRLAGRGVRYLHGGWASLVAELEAVAAATGVQRRSGRASAVAEETDGITVVLDDGVAVDARAVVVATGGPGQADRLLGGSSPALHAWAQGVAPVLAACLDVAVADAPRRRPVSTYGLDMPVYAVDHAVTARLAPPGGAVHHALFYEPDRQPSVDHRAVLEAMLDVHDPGWRSRAVSVAYRRRAVVAHDRPRPGLAGAVPPGVRVPGLTRVLVAGDWLVGHGMLADAALASGEAAGAAAAEAARRRTSVEVAVAGAADHDRAGAPLASSGPHGRER